MISETTTHIRTNNQDILESIGYDWSYEKNSDEDDLYGDKENLTPFPPLPNPHTPFSCKRKYSLQGMDYYLSKNTEKKSHFTTLPIEMVIRCIKKGVYHPGVYTLDTLLKKSGIILSLNK